MNYPCFKVGQLVRTKQGIGRISAITNQHYNVRQKRIDPEVHYYVVYENGSDSKWKAEHLLSEVTGVTAEESAEVDIERQRLDKVRAAYQDSRFAKGRRVR